MNDVPHAAAGRPMSPRMRQRVLRLNSVFLAAFATIGLLGLDIPGIWLSRGPMAAVLGESDGAGIGFLEAHGLALIMAVLFWRASRTVPETSWHATACAVHALLGTVNLLFWQVFVDSGMLWLAYAPTAAHFVFVLLHAVALGTVVWSREPAGP